MKEIEYNGKEKLYRHYRPEEVMVSGADIVDAYHEVPCGDTPWNSVRPVSFWNCRECPSSNEVTIRQTFRCSSPSKAIPIMNCPECGIPMHFWHYVKKSELLLVRDNEPSVTEWMMKYTGRVPSAQQPGEASTGAPPFRPDGGAL